MSNRTSAAYRFSGLQLALAGLLVATPGAICLAVDDIEVHRVFGPEAPGPYKHPASITELDGGDLYLVYYGGAGEYATDTAVYGSRRRQGESRFSPPEVIADTPYRSEGNPVVWQAPNGQVWLYYVVRYGQTWSTSRIQAKVSDDGAKTWSDPLVVAWEEGMMVRNRPIALADGDYLLPIYHETGHDREWVGDDTTSLFLRYDPQTHLFSETNRIKSRLGNLQPAVVQLDDKHLICYCRRGGDYQKRNDGWLVRAESHDGGRTWSEGVESRFPNPNAAVDFIKLKNGHLLLVYNDSMNERTPLTVAISRDQDRSYPYRRNIAEGDNDYAYPTAIQASDGRIHVIFTSHGRTVINHAVFDERAIGKAGTSAES
jgi:predicted neuraminidase